MLSTTYNRLAIVANHVFTVTPVLLSDTSVNTDSTSHFMNKYYPNPKISQKLQRQPELQNIFLSNKMPSRNGLYHLHSSSISSE